MSRTETGKQKKSKTVERSKPKAAILTFCNNNGPVNYGQILQCYAVQNIFEKKDYDTKVVRYQKLAVEELVTVRTRRFREFVAKYIHTTSPCYSAEDVERETADCEVLICGSDQVWHPDTIDDVWMLRFGRKDQKRMSYAASGIFFDTEKVRGTCKELGRQLAKFETVTVREAVAKEMLSRYTDKKIDVVSDPTLGLTREEWDGVASDDIMADIRGPYILCYCLGSIRSYPLILRELARVYGAKVYYIPSNLFNEGRYGFMTPVFDAGPTEFLSLVKHAEAVCTDSYHGVIMSHIYEKDCYCLKRMKEGADRFGGSVRINNLASESGIKVKWVKNVNDLRVQDDEKHQ